ncbi:MAG: DEAD/DEAH box helicase [Candidatus Omnitrophica bacterium]|nr:DEAD/DEAH box helicase [Candidatus Omnitrophota bacterium]
MIHAAEQLHPRAATQEAPSFYGLGIAPKILEILEKIKFRVPTPIQQKAIPPAIQGKDVIGVAQTGTGKTHAFAIPMVQLLAQKKGIGLVLAPTRELAIQINEAFNGIAPAFGMHTACLIGGAPMEPQNQALSRNPRIIIATPGRLIDHIGQWHVMPEEVSMLVLDEADRMLDMGFAPQIDRILKVLPKNRQTMLFSATIPEQIMRIASQHMKLPVSIEIAPSGTAAETVAQELFIVKKDVKKKLLGKLLAQYHGAVLMFTRTKFGARKLCQDLKHMGFRAAEIHSNRSLTQRRDALDGFKAGRYRILVATDIAARGIDVTGIELVVNYDLPDDAENYVHRIGRTGRAGHKGRAISFAMPDQKEEVRSIEKLIRTTLPVSRHPDMPPEQFSDAAPQQHGYRPGQRSRGNSQGRNKHGGGGRPSRFHR